MEVTVLTESGVRSLPDMDSEKAQARFSISSDAFL